VTQTQQNEVGHLLLFVHGQSKQSNFMLSLSLSLSLSHIILESNVHIGEKERDKVMGDSSSFNFFSSLFVLFVLVVLYSHIDRGERVLFVWAYLRPIAVVI